MRRNSAHCQARAAIVLLATLVAFGLQAGSLTAQSLWRDEVDALCYAFEFPRLLVQAIDPQAGEGPQAPCACPPSPLSPGAAPSPGPSLQNLARVLRPMIRQNGPLYFFLLRGWIALAGSSEYALRFFSLGSGVLIVPLIYILGRRLLGSMAGLFAALIVAASPYLTWYGQEVKMYTLLPALVLLALYGLRRVAEGGKGHWWAVHGIATSLAFYTHIWSALLVPVQMVLLASWWPLWRRRWAGLLVSLGLLTLPYLPLAIWQVPAAFVERETGFPRHTLGEMALILVNGWSAGITGQGWPGGAIICGGIALLGLAGGLFRRPSPLSGDAGAETYPGRPSLLGLTGWFAVPLISIWFISLRQPLFTDRYLIWVAPAFYLLAGAGLAFAWRRWHWLAPSLLAAIWILFGSNLHIQATVPIKSDLRAAAAYVEARYRPQDLLIFQIPHIRYTFDYYFGPEDYIWADGLYTNHRGAGGAYLTTEEATGFLMAQIVRGYERIWLVTSETEMWDARGLVQGWLESNGERMERATFARVDVYRYRLGGAR